MTDPRTTTLENALKALGINPDDDPVHHAKRWIEGRDTDRRERDQALTERDNATARVSARDLRINALECERDAALKQAEENKRRGEQSRQALNHFFIKMGLNQNADLDQHMAHVAKVCESFDTLTQIRRAIGITMSTCSNDAVEAVKVLYAQARGADARVEQAKAALAALMEALDDAGAPKNYHLEDDSKRPIAAAERIRLLGERVHALREQLRNASDITTHVNALMEAHNALDALGAPRLADGCPLTLAARIWALFR